jgi:Lon protease-like protein
MSEILEATVYEAVPVFPLPEYVLFPQTLIPFHIFEPRFRQLVADCMSDGRLIVVAGLQPGWEADYFGAPPVHAVAGIGKIVNEERFEDGRFNIFVHCLGRVRILETLRTEPYRMARAEVVPDLPVAVGDAGRVRDAVERLRSCVVGLASRIEEEARTLSKVLGSTEDPGVLTNRLAAIMVGDPRVRQELLEERSPLARVERLTTIAAERMFDSVETATEGEEAGAGWMN